MVEFSLATREARVRFPASACVLFFFVLFSFVLFLTPDANVSSILSILKIREKK